MPAYNCEKYLNEAIESILNQTYKEFEFIIINDGSKDRTEEIILSYKDPRIVYLKNEENKGLIYTLNRGLENSKGKYIARMDGDDICLLSRFEKQVNHLQQYPAIDVLATTVSLIDENNKPVGKWKDDANNTSSQSIKSFLPTNNCIAHPTVMGKREVFLQYKYDPDQKLSEDYDLWLRMTAEKRNIDKLNEALLQHRILQTSFTRTRNVNIFYKIMTVKLIFVKKQLRRGKVNSFIILTLINCITDFIKGTAKEIKKKLTK